MSFTKLNLIRFTRRTLATNICCNGMYQVLSHPGPCLTNYQQNRYKQKKIRFKAPKPAKDKKNQPTLSYNVKKYSKPALRPEFAARSPTDNIWFSQYYPVQLNPLEGAIAKHKAYADPAMMDNLEGLLYIDMVLNMATKKKTKFLSSVSGTLVYPHHFEDETETRCIFLSKNPENISLSKSLGVTHAGGLDLLDLLKADTVTKTMYDYATCTPDIYQELLSHRNLFKEKFPHQKQGTVNNDVEGMLNSLMKGVHYQSKKIAEDASSMQVAFGKLNMNTEDLVENFQKLVAKLCVNRSPALGPLIMEAKIIAPPSEEEFQLKVELYVPGYDTPAEQRDGGEGEKEGGDDGSDGDDDDDDDDDDENRSVAGAN